MLNPQLLNHLDAYQDEEEKDRVTGPVESSSLASDDANESGDDHASSSNVENHRTSLWVDMKAALPQCLSDSFKRIYCGYHELHCHQPTSIFSKIQVGFILVVAAQLILAIERLRCHLPVADDVYRNLHVLWNLLVLSCLVWNLRKAKSSKRDDDESDHACETTGARIVECRRNLSILLASVGAPPMVPLPHLKEYVPIHKPSKDELLNLASADPEVDRLLEVLGRVTRQNVALIQRLDSIVEWVRDATALRILGTAHASSSGSWRRGILSVERLERSAASRLMRLRESRLPNDIEDTSCLSQLRASRAFDTMPLSTLRRHVAMVGLQQLRVLCCCLSTEDDDGKVLDHEIDQLDPPPVVTLSWLRSLRKDMVHVLYCAVDETTRELIERTAQAVDGFGGAPNATKARCKALRRAVATAEEGIAYLQAYPHVAAIIPEFQSGDATKSAGAGESSIDVTNRILELQNQSDAFATALLALQESLFSSPWEETHRCWGEVRDLSSQIGVGVEALGTELHLNHGGNGQASASTSYASADDSHEGGLVGQAEQEFVLVEASCDVVNGSELVDDKGRNASSLCGNKTLVYSGQGSQIRSTKRRLRPSPERNMARLELLEPLTFHRSLFDELRSRLDMIHLEEVEADALFNATATAEKDEPDRIPGEVGRQSSSALGALPFDSAGKDGIAAAFLKELRVALREESLNADSCGAGPPGDL